MEINETVFGAYILIKEKLPCQKLKLTGKRIAPSIVAKEVAYFVV